MRKINTGDVFAMARLMRDGNIVKIVGDAFSAGREEGADKSQIGIGVITDIMCSCTDAHVEEQFYEILSGICEQKPEEIKNQSLESTIEDIKRICEENNILNFWRSAFSLGEKIQN